MKKFITVIVLSLGLLTGCQGNSPDTYMKTDFVLDVDIVRCDKNYKATLKRSGARIQIDYTYPEPLQGLKYTLEGDCVSIGYSDLDPVKSDKQLVSHSNCALLHDALEDAISNSRGKSAINGMTNCGSYNLKLDTKKGLPKTLVIDDASLTCSFSEAKQT